MIICRQSLTHSTLSPATARRIRLVLFRMVCACVALSGGFAFAQTGDLSATTAGQDQLILGQATLSEIVKNGIPFNSARAFSISLGRIYCFTDFVAVDEKTVIYHNWYYKDQRRATLKLALRPPRWATFSSVKLRDTDRGPWQVEVTTEQGDVLQILRFSVID